MSKGSEMEEWCLSFKASKLWLTAVQTDKTGSRHTLTSYCLALKTFCNWIAKNPDQLIAERRAELKNDETEMNSENKVREFCLWLEKEQKKGKRTVVTKYHAPIKSFYSYNNVPLRLKTPRYVMRERQPHTTEEIKVLLQIANVRERAFIMILKDSGMSREDALRLTYGDIQKEYEAHKDFVHIRVVRQKESIEYDAFLGPNAVNALRPYLEYRQRQGEKVTKNTPLMATLNGGFMTTTNFSELFWRISQKVGFMTSPHRFRKYFETHMGLAAPSILVKSWMGHSLGVEGHYFMPDIEKQREKYKEAYKEIDLERQEPNEVERRKQTIRDQIALMVASGNLTQEKADGIINNLKKYKRMEEVEEGFKNDMRSYRTKDKDCKDGNCQKVIEETELTALLQQGWHFVATLPSGKVVVTNE